MKTIQLLIISKIIVVFFFIITIGACESTGSKSTVTEDIVFEPMVIELEDMKLTSAEIVPIDSISGGKAVKLIAKDALATTKLSLPEGEYAAAVVFMGIDIDSDGFYLIANNKARRTFTHRHNQWGYGNRFITFKSDGINPVVLSIASAFDDEETPEWGMLIDKIEIVEYCSSAEVLERWTK